MKPANFFSNWVLPNAVYGASVSLLAQASRLCLRLFYFKTGSEAPLMPANINYQHKRGACTYLSYCKSIMEKIEGYFYESPPA